jgi:hypothetical protein
MIEQHHFNGTVLAPVLQGGDHDLAHIGGQGMQGIWPVQGQMPNPVLYAD